jgi:hypothetical protein
MVEALRRRCYELGESRRGADREPRRPTDRFVIGGGVCLKRARLAPSRVSRSTRTSGAELTTPLAVGCGRANGTLTGVARKRGESPVRVCQHPPRTATQADSFKFLISAMQSDATIWIRISSGRSLVGRPLVCIFGEWSTFDGSLPWFSSEDISGRVHIKIRQV